MRETSVVAQLSLLWVDRLCSSFGGLREHAVSAEAKRGLRHKAVTSSTEMVTPTDLSRYAGQINAVGVLIQAPKISHTKPLTFRWGAWMSSGGWICEVPRYVLPHKLRSAKQSVWGKTWGKPTTFGL